MHFSASSQWSKICFGDQGIMFNGKKGLKFSQIVLVRLEGVTPPPPKRSAFFFNPSLSNVWTLKMETWNGSKPPLLPYTWSSFGWRDPFSGCCQVWHVYPSDLTIVIWVQSDLLALAQVQHHLHLLRSLSVPVGLEKVHIFVLFKGEILTHIMSVMET